MARINILSTSNSLTFSDFLELDFDEFVVTGTSPTSLSGTSGAFSFSMGGTFTFGPGGLTGGTLQTFYLAHLGTLIGSMTEIDRDVVEIANIPFGQEDAFILSGSDTIISEYNSADIIRTYSGRDTITAGTGNDKIFGGSGIDTMVIQDSFADSQILATNRGFVVNSDSGRDNLKGIELLRFDDTTVALQKGNNLDNTLTGDIRPAFNNDVILALGGNDTVSGLRGQDHLIGGDGNDRLNGGGGSDHLLGGAGSDDLRGGSGADTLSGQSGRDRLIGGTGNDTLTGGAQLDHFVFATGHGNDTITDFDIGRDLIELGRGARGMSDLSFAASGSDVIVSFSDVTITVEDVTLSAMNDSSNFIF